MIEQVIELLPFSAGSVRTERRDRTTAYRPDRAIRNGTSACESAAWNETLVADAQIARSGAGRAHADHHDLADIVTTVVARVRQAQR
jgi:hypothetical protein